MFKDEIDEAEIVNNEVSWYGGEYEAMTEEDAAAARASHKCRRRRR
jgi:hypothetical protein